ncbi:MULTISPECIES: MgtC/SapB family protein [Amycolatopsis]|uniref:MgtC/SapB/SrpB/YhiD N-terminal domain-containing protein n=1 Tax=Amycolatopsis tucumanensis TaxID=401106 RepID=A0ABP7IR79_9PSEU|nr:MgtC/SapB family protein [Amycolatopsis tucumanensis]MCF6426581.1 MgtC/SapB family protein [Amycolatopsis tucumanensis]MCF6428862.1 MgtC/SapB family protein [Amycolatopsis tucumanensis]
MFSEPSGQGWQQVGELVLALVLCSLIGLERELKQKSAGLRTHTLVGVGAALFLLVSKYGFTDVLEPGRIVLDPSRVAAQIVSGIGFIGGGLIFVRRDVVRGLTTAAVVWMSVAVGCACAAGLPLLAVVVTAAHFVVVYGYPPLVRLLTRRRPATTTVRLAYRDGEGALRRILELATRSGYSVQRALTNRRDSGGVIDLSMRLLGPRGVDDLLARLAEQPGILAVETGAIDDTSE